MPKQRSHGDGGLFWSEDRQRWIAAITVGWRPNGKRIVRRASGKTKTEAKDKLKGLIKEYDEGRAQRAKGGYTVADAIADWLANYELTGRGTTTTTRPGGRAQATAPLLPHPARTG